MFKKSLIHQILKGKIFIATTDTTIGIGGICRTEMIAKINLVKERSLQKRLVIMVDSIGMARKFNSWSLDEEKWAKKYWPGKLTIVVNDNLALRMPDDPILLKLIKLVGPIYMTSCNKTNQLPLKSIKDAKEIFREKVDIFLENPQFVYYGPSTIIYPKKKNAILRQGKLKLS